MSTILTYTIGIPIVTGPLMPLIILLLVPRTRKLLGSAEWIYTIGFICVQLMVLSPAVYYFATANDLAAMVALWLPASSGLPLLLLSIIFVLKRYFATRKFKPNE